MSTRPLEYIDLDAWMRVTGLGLEVWEARAITTLSRVYKNQYSSAMEGNPLPRREPLSEDEKQSVSDKLRKILDARVSQSNPKSKVKDKVNG